MTTRPIKNPYRPRPAAPPSLLAGRGEHVARFGKMLRGAPEVPANLRITGLRGVGKSALLRELDTVATADGWVVARFQVEPRHDTERSLAESILGVAEAAQRRMSRAHKVRAQVPAASEPDARELITSLEDVALGLARRQETNDALVESLFGAVKDVVEGGHTGFAILLDEAQLIQDDMNRHGDHPLSMLLDAVRALQEAGVPVALVLCGLPSLRTHVQKAHTSSDTMFTDLEVGDLDIDSARDAFVGPLEEAGLTADDDLVVRVLEAVEGHPLFLQLWGAELWDAAQDAGLDHLTVELLDVVEPDIRRRLDEDFYAERIDALTPSQQELLAAAAGCEYPPLTTASVRDRTDKSDGNINILMGRLVDQGILHRLEKGQYAYTVPGLHGYLQRRMCLV